MIGIFVIRKMNKHKILLFSVGVIFHFISISVWAQLKPVAYQNPDHYRDTMPIPKKFDDLLFYVQRSNDRNTAVYEVNFNEEGEIVHDEPILVWWVKYESDTSASTLSYLQRKLTYGVEWENIIGGYKLKFAAFKKRNAYLRQDLQSGNYYVYTTINKKPAILHKIFVEVKGGSFLIPKIGMVDFYGSDPKTGKPVHERFDY